MDNGIVTPYEASPILGNITATKSFQDGHKVINDPIHVRRLLSILMPTSQLTFSICLIRVTFDWTKPLLALLILSNSNGFVI
jgi:hypothetical protein